MEDTIKEKWYKFTRVNCTAGFIDIWVGDMADNPNSDRPSNINLNAFSEAFRLNGGGEWVKRRNGIGGGAFLYENCNKFSAEVIFNKLNE